MDVAVDGKGAGLLQPHQSLAVQPRLSCDHSCARTAAVRECTSGEDGMDVVGTTFTASCASAVRLLPPDKVAAEPDVLARRLGRFTFKLYGSRAYLANRPMRPDMTLSGHHVIRYLAMPRAPGEEWLLQRGEGVRTALFASSVPVLTAPAVA